MAWILHSMRGALAIFCLRAGRHPARLNYGNCISYACAKTPPALLWVGDDFDLTDAKRAQES